MSYTAWVLPLASSEDDVVEVLGGVLSFPTVCCASDVVGVG